MLNGPPPVLEEVGDVFRPHDRMGQDDVNKNQCRKLEIGSDDPVDQCIGNIGRKAPIPPPHLVGIGGLALENCENGKQASKSKNDRQLLLVILQDLME